MTHSRCSLALLFTLVLSVGCGGARTFADSYAELEAEGEVRANVLCDCYAQFPNPYPNKATCVADWYQPATPEERECIEDASALDPEASLATIECELDAVKKYTDCFEQRLNCGNLMNTFLECRNEFFANLETCPPLPAVVQNALNQC